MPRILVETIVVPEAAIDVNRHVSNLAYLRWMQDVAIAHSTAQGWPVERYVERREGWVVRSHFIEYLLPAFALESLALLTWVADLREQRSRRRYLFWRARDSQVIAKAETLWVYVDARTGRGRPIPPELRSAFDVVPDEEDVLEITGLRSGA